MAVAVKVGSIVPGDPEAGIDQTGGRFIVTGTLTLTGNYGTATSHGDTVNLASAGIPVTVPPGWVEIQENQGSSAAGTGNPPLGYVYIYCQGTTIANGLLQIMGPPTTGGPGSSANDATCSARPE